MKNEKRSVVRATFAPETRFNIRPHPVATFRVLEQDRFGSLRDELLGQELESLVDPALNSYVRRAANEAAAVAWTTGFPLLVFPALFEEKVSEAAQHLERQHCIRERSRELLAV